MHNERTELRTRSAVNETHARLARCSVLRATKIDRTKPWSRLKNKVALFAIDNFLPLAQKPISRPPFSTDVQVVLKEHSVYSGITSKEIVKLEVLVRSTPSLAHASRRTSSSSLFAVAFVAALRFASAFLTGAQTGHRVGS